MKRALTVVVLALLCSIHKAHCSDVHKNAAEPQQYRQLAALALYEQASSVAEQYRTQDEQKHARQNAVDVASLPPKDGWDKAVLFVNGGLFFVGLAGVFIALVTWRTIRISGERQLRAYVMCESVSILNVAPAPEDFIGEPTSAHRTYSNRGPFAQLIIKNTGQTPAYHVHHWGNWSFREYPLLGPLLEIGRDIRPMPSVLGPGIIATKQFRNMSALNDAQIQQLRNGRGAIYIYGEISYKDAFGRNHFTKYRLMHNDMSGVVGVSTDFTFCEDGNEAD